MLSYTTLSGWVLDLSDLPTEEQTFFETALAAYRRSMGWADFANTYVYSANMPLLRPTNGMVTRDTYDHPLFVALRDLGNRLGIAQNEVGIGSATRLDVDPVADEWVPVAEAAERKGVGAAGLHYAIKRGDVLARPAKPGGSRLVVSCRSLDHWQPSAARQAAGRAGGRRSSQRAEASPLVEEYIERHPHKAGRAEVVIKGTGVPVWALVGYWQGVGDVKKVADDYELPIEAIEAATEYYRQNKAVIDNRLEENQAD